MTLAGAQVVNGIKLWGLISKLNSHGNTCKTVWTLCTWHVKIPLQPAHSNPSCSHTHEGPLTLRFPHAVFTWLYSGMWAAAPLLGWSNYVPESVGSYCSINWLEDANGSKSYVTCIFLFVFVIPVLIMAFSYGIVLLKVKQVKSHFSALCMCTHTFA